ncbi:hypothetical protein N7497_006086 [Penicillium chrysogenum]|jgi:hypothetical protein|uniref:Uncharacterized protein n=1 Tax=Penicillium chrysogenum TaxID=5076 RepID=A0ABQ8WRU5_PENCH|nr:hypothetical protein N7505_004019 [Penicillium chrysogenum]KAJ6157201.1 hypothetical protein N7497_006086 [Penicillium chrysogenum]
MSITQKQCLAHAAREKLVDEAARADHDLRFLVGHANLLDILIPQLTDGELEQEWLFDAFVGEAGDDSPDYEQQPQLSETTGEQYVTLDLQEDWILDWTTSDSDDEDGYDIMSSSSDDEDGSHSNLQRVGNFERLSVCQPMTITPTKPQALHETPTDSSTKCENMEALESIIAPLSTYVESLDLQSGSSNATKDACVGIQHST